MDVPFGGAKFVRKIWRRIVSSVSYGAILAVLILAEAIIWAVRKGAFLKRRTDLPHAKR